MGSKSTQSTQIPEYIEEAGKLALQRAQEIQAMGYVPYMGPEVAAINPYEQAMATNVGSMASAFGLAAPVGMDMGGMPTVTQGGMTGYSSYPAYMASLERLRETRPEMYDYFSGMTRFDPITGALNPEYDARMQAGIDGTPTGGTVAQPATSNSGGGNDDDPLERHYSIFPETRPKSGPYAAKPSGRLDTKGQIGKYSGSMGGMSPIEKVKADVGYAKAKVKKDTGKLFGGLFGG